MVPEELQQAEQAHRRGDLNLAERLYRSVLAANGRDASALCGLATLLMQRNDLAQASPLLDAAAAVEPDAADIALKRAHCLQRKGEVEPAMAEARRCANLVVGDEAFSVDVAQLMITLGDAGSAVALLRSGPVTQRKTALLLAHALGQTGAWDAAVSYLRQLCDRQPGDAELARQLSIAAARLRDYPLAIAAYEDYLAATSLEAVDHVRFADLCLLAREVDRAAEQLALAAAAGADGADYHLLCARLARLRGDDAAALAACRKSLQRNPRQGHAWGIAVELATPEELPLLRDSLEQQLASAHGHDPVLSEYDRQLMSYALADAADRCDDVAAAAEALRIANGLQLAELGKSGKQYQAQQEETRFALAQQRFPVAPSSTALGGDDAGRLVFIVGMPRSGTTLVERVLARLQGVVAGGENDALGFVISQYERDLASGQLPLPQDLHRQQWTELARRYWSLTVTRGPVVTDKMPHNYLHVGMILGMFPDARVVQMRRDARDTALSIYSRPFPLDHNYACDPYPLGHAWQLAQRYMDYWRSLDDSRVMDLEFRDFVTEPVAASQRLAEFCGLPWHEGCLQGSEQEGPSFTFSERQVRRPISPDNQGRWNRYRSVLPELFSALPDG